MSMSSTFLIVDDHPIFQQGLSRFLAEEFPSVETIQVSTARDAELKFREQSLSLVILDLSLPDKNGLEVLKEMKERQPSTPILILTFHSEDRYAVRAFRAGADGYITKDSSPALFGDAIRKVLGGRKYVSASMAEKLAIQVASSRGEELHETLSDREFQVLGLLAQGKTIGSIGVELHLSVNTISTYRVRILEKLNLKTTAELVTYAIQNKLVD